MARVNIDQARSGMVLASEVVDRRGRLLMPGGKTLTEHHLAAFRMWGVSFIEVEGADVPEAEEPILDERTLARADEVVRHLFTVAGFEHPYLRTLGDLARTRIAREIMLEAPERA